MVEQIKQLLRPIVKKVLLVILTYLEPLTLICFFCWVSLLISQKREIHRQSIPYFNTYSCIRMVSPKFPTYDLYKRKYRTDDSKFRMFLFAVLWNSVENPKRGMRLIKIFKFQKETFKLRKDNALKVRIKNTSTLRLKEIDEWLVVCALTAKIRKTPRSLFREVTFRILPMTTNPKVGVKYKHIISRLKRSKGKSVIQVGKSSGFLFRMASIRVLPMTFSPVEGLSASFCIDKDLILPISKERKTIFTPMTFSPVEGLSASFCIDKDLILPISKERKTIFTPMTFSPVEGLSASFCIDKDLILPISKERKTIFTSFFDIPPISNGQFGTRIRLRKIPRFAIRRFKINKKVVIHNFTLQVCSLLNELHIQRKKVRDAQSDSSLHKCTRIPIPIKAYGRIAIKSLFLPKISYKQKKDAFLRVVLYREKRRRRRVRRKLRKFLIRIPQITYVDKRQFNKTNQRSSLSLTIQFICSMLIWITPIVWILALIHELLTQDVSYLSFKSFNNIVTSRQIDNLDNFIGIESIRSELNAFQTRCGRLASFKNQPNGYLFTGVTGSGKSDLVKRLIQSTQIECLFTNGSTLLNFNYGLTNLRTLFATAKLISPCIIFIDEIQALAFNRNNFFRVKSMGVKTAVFAEFLVQMDGFLTRQNIVILATTRNLTNLDPAFYRPGRFDKIFQFELPSDFQRKQFFQVLISQKLSLNFTDAVLDWFTYLTVGYSGALLKTLVNEFYLCYFNEKTTSPVLLSVAFEKVQLLKTQNDL